MAEEERHIVAITMAGCPPCEMLKMYVEQKDIKVNFIEVDTEISRDVVEKLFPNCEGFPYVLVNGQDVSDLIFYLESGL